MVGKMTRSSVLSRRRFSTSSSRSKDSGSHFQQKAPVPAHGFDPQFEGGQDVVAVDVLNQAVRKQEPQLGLAQVGRGLGGERGGEETGEQRQGEGRPGRAEENSPAFQRWARDVEGDESRQGRQKPGPARDVVFRP